MVLLRETHVCFRIRMTLKAEVLSSPEVGSSRSNTAGSCRRQRPMETLLRSPPERPRARRVLDRCVSRSSERREETMAARFEVLGFRSFAAKRKVSETVRRGRQWSCWGT